VLSPVKESDSQPLDLRPDEWEVLAEIDAERDVGALAAHLGRSTFEVAKIIYGLVSAGVVQVREQHGEIPQEELHIAIAAVDQLLREGRLEEAERRANDLEQTYPDSPELAVLSGKTLTAQGRMRAATEAYTRAVSLDPLLADAHLALGFSAARTGELKRAADAWHTYLRLSPNGGPGHIVAEALQHVRALDQILEAAR
jgi:tetratricopeptide (TPR) repeat protein